MSFQWLDMRIAEEKDRRRREGEILERLPRALEETHGSLAACIKDYAKAFGPEAADIHLSGSRIKATVREERDGKWQARAKVEVTLAPELPGFRIDRGGEPLSIEVGILPGDKHFYKDGEQNITVEELTRRILDRALFPKLGE